MQKEAGVQKVICAIINEWVLWVPGIKKQQDLQVLFQKDNFDPENLSPILDKAIKSLGGWLDFVPKYHPELNFIGV